MFGVTAGYHRYFYTQFQNQQSICFFLALLAQSSGQRGVIWWARNHRHHHRYSDKPKDLHSPQQNGFWHAHIGWIFHNDAYETHKNVSDLERCWELRLLDQYPWYPQSYWLCLLVVPWLAWSVCWIFLEHSIIVSWNIYHQLFGACLGITKIQTKDTSRNNWFLALLTLGEGWHNNHHHYMRSARQGFFWWEVDPTYYVLVVLSWMQIVWELSGKCPDNIKTPA